MTTAAVDVLGFLPGPVSKNNAGAADLLAGELFAYAVSSGVAVVDVRMISNDAADLHTLCFAFLRTDLTHLGCPGASHAACMCAAWRSQECLHNCSQLVSQNQWHSTACAYQQECTICQGVY